MSLRRGLTVAGAGGMVVAAPGIYAGAEAAVDLVVTRYAPAAPGWPRGRRLTITVVADLHAGGPNMGLARVQQVVDAANALHSDLIVLLGDYFATHRFVTERVPPSAWARELARLEAPLGAYSILGNHDWWYDIEGTRRALAAVRIPVLENNVVQLGPLGHRFWLAGLGDQLAYFLGPDTFRGVDDLPGTLAQISSDAPVILLAHEPDIFPKVPARVALTLAGHTRRTDSPALHRADLDTVALRRAFLLRPHRRRWAPHDRVRRARLQQSTAAARRTAGDCAHHVGCVTCPAM